MLEQTKDMGMDNKGIWILGLIALGAIILLIARTTDDDRGGTPEPPPVPGGKPEQPRLDANSVSIQCPVCQGYRYTMVPGRTGMRRRVCQFCGGKGGKVLTIPPGNVRCTDCEGFGRRRGQGDVFAICPRCNGRGFMKAPFQPSE